MSDTLKEIKRVDKETFERIYNTCYYPLCFHAQKRVGSKSTAEDVVHDVFEKLWEERESIHTSVPAYLYQCVTNACIKHLKHIEVERKYSGHVRDMSGIGYDSNNPLSMLIVQEKKDEIEKAKNSLPERSKEMLVLWEEGLSYQEIVEKLGIPVGSVGPQINRIIKELREYLKIRDHTKK
jgi:RNA polymerase sigma-70 factor (ECF subfamily)